LIIFHLTQAGLVSSNDFKIALIFSNNFESSNSALPTGICKFQVLSSLYSILHFLISSIVALISFVTVQAFGDGIKPFGHNALATFAKSLIIS